MALVYGLRPRVTARPRRGFAPTVTATAPSVGSFLSQVRQWMVMRIITTHGLFSAPGEGDSGAVGQATGGRGGGRAGGPYFPIITTSAVKPAGAPSPVRKRYILPNGMRVEATNEELDRFLKPFERPPLPPKEVKTRRERPGAPPVEVVLPPEIAPLPISSLVPAPAPLKQELKDPFEEDAIILLLSLMD